MVMKDENVPSGLLSTMHWLSVDPQSKLLRLILEGEQQQCVPRSPELIQLIMHELHHVPFAAHPGFTKVHKDIKKLLYWPNMRRDIEEYCHRCQINKSYRQVTSAPLQLMPILILGNRVPSTSSQTYPRAKDTTHFS
jgi:hypothetical protein